MKITKRQLRRLIKEVAYGDPNPGEGGQTHPGYGDPGEEYKNQVNAAVVKVIVEITQAWGQTMDIDVAYELDVLLDHWSEEGLMDLVQQVDERV
jgi:hypothetical protein